MYFSSQTAGAKGRMAAAKGVAASIVLAVTLATPMAAVHAANYTIDTKGAHAFINAKFKHLGYSILSATFKDFSGSFSFEPGNLAASKVMVDIDVASIDSNHAERDKHMRGDRFLDTDSYPKASFTSTRIEPKSDGRFLIHGDLTLRGVTKPIAIDASLIDHGKDPWGGYRAGFQGYVTLDMREFGVDTFKPLHTVDMELFLEGVRDK